MMEPTTDSPADPPVPPPRRRNFFRWVTYGLGGLASAVVGLPIVGFLIAPIFRKQPDIWRDVLAMSPHQLESSIMIQQTG